MGCGGTIEPSHEGAEGRFSCLVVVGSFTSRYPESG